MKKICKVLLAVVLVLVLLAGGYLAYVLIDYHRIGDQTLELAYDGNTDIVELNEEQTLLSWNIGFGAYEADFGFFMDGGTESWAFSEERVRANVERMSELVEVQEPDFAIFQEVDRDSTRSYHVDEVPILGKALIDDGYDGLWGCNYDSPFLMYPFTQPHGKSVSGLVTLADYDITAANRVSLPVEDSLMKLIDLDRCYTVSRIPTESGRELVLYNAHLSAYTSDGTVALEQLELLLGDMQSEYEKGNYVICGGDFNKDLLGNSSEYFGEADREYTWAQPIPEGVFDGYDIRLIVPFDEENPVASCRNADSAYHEGQYTLTVDGFLVSGNVTVEAAEVIDTQFAYSDHNPVTLRFTLKG